MSDPSSPSAARFWRSALSERLADPNLPGPTRAVLDELVERRLEWANRSGRWSRSKARTRRLLATLSVLPALPAAAIPVYAGFGGAKLAAVSGLLGLISALLTALYARFRTIAAEEKAESAWLVADRLSRAYAGLVARLLLGDPPSRLLLAGDLLEASARFGAPEGLVSELKAAARFAAGESVGGEAPNASEKG